MTELNCENFCIAAMARADGYQPEMSSEQIDKHIAGCAECRHEFSQLKDLTDLLDKHSRRRGREDLWTRIESRLPKAALAQSASRAWRPFLLLGLLLLGYKLVEMISAREFGLLFKLVPMVLIVSAFAYLKENPFKINPQLNLEEEEVTG